MIVISSFILNGCFNRDVPGLEPDTLAAFLLLLPAFLEDDGVDGDDDADLLLLSEGFFVTALCAEYT